MSDRKTKLHCIGDMAVPLETGGNQKDLQIVFFIYTTTASSLPHGGIDRIIYSS
jgi:hypothetical protein